ncbi:MAG: caspase family protein [Gammaproteobacteria bacterium]|nr:caspase family protein [Gammaproteobacteria bacterium]
MRKFILLITSALVFLDLSACGHQPVSKGFFDFLSPPGHKETVVQSRQCYASLPAGGTRQNRAGAVFLLAAGSNTGQLAKADEDAREFSRAMREHFAIPPERICLLENVYRQELENALEALKEVSISRDMAIIFYSGHGSHIADDDSDERDCWDEALVTSDVKLKKAPDADDVFRDDVFVKLVNDLPAKRVLTVLDACFSGGMYMAGIAADHPLKNARNKLFVKNKRIGAASLCTNPHAGKAETLKGLLLSASSEGEPAWETDDGGVFTRALLKALAESSEGNLGEGEWWNRVFAETVRHVRTKSGKSQTPRRKGHLTGTAEGEL